MISRIVLVLVALSTICAAPAIAAEEPRIKVVVVPFDVAAPLKAEEPELSESLAILAGATLSKRYEIVDRGAFQGALAQMKKKVGDLHDNLQVCLHLASLLEAEHVIYGRVSTFGGRIVMHMKDLDVALKKWGKTESCMADDLESLPEAVPLLLVRIGFPKADDAEEPSREPPAEPPSEPPTPRPGHRAWVEQLRDPDAGKRFSAAVELGKSHGDHGPAAVKGLIRLVSTDPDTFVRRAAARALGELHAMEAVPALIEVLAETEVFVSITAHQALKILTRHDFGLRDGMTRSELKKIVEAGKAWWAEHKPK